MVRAVVMGVSAGGFVALKQVLPGLPRNFALPIAIVQHIGEGAGEFMADYLNSVSNITIKEAEDKEPLHPGHAYIAPAGYHLLIEPDETFSLSVDARVNYSCPAIDVLFESAADAYGADLIGVILTGANADGAHGLRTVVEKGGIAVVQAPETAEAPMMPRSALETVHPQYIVELSQLAALLIELSDPPREDDHARA